MTNNKMIVKMKYWAEHYGNPVIIKVYDKWSFEVETTEDGKTCMSKVKKVRHKIRVTDIVEDFEKKAGPFFDMFKVTQSFRELEKRIEADNFSPKTYDIIATYKDTKEAFDKQWNELHPDMDYETYQENRRKHARGHMLDVYSHYYDDFSSHLGRNVWPIRYTHRRF